VKCLVFEERENVRISDSAIDLVPGDEQIVDGKIEILQRLWPVNIPSHNMTVYPKPCG
jgi:hypothetical protein